MAYSRWSTSTWYTFWSASSPTGNWPTETLKMAQVFEICDFPSYSVTYGELKEKGLAKVLREVEAFYHNPENSPAIGVGETKVKSKKTKAPTKSEMLELGHYMTNFMEDIDKHFKFGTFARYEWWYPLRNNIIWKWRSLVKRKSNI